MAVVSASAVATACFTPLLQEKIQSGSIAVFVTGRSFCGLTSSNIDFFDFESLVLGRFQKVYSSVNSSRARMMSLQILKASLTLTAF